MNNRPQSPITEPAIWLGSQLRTYLERENISQEAAAARYETKQSWICRILSGQFTARSRVARKMCEDADLPFIDDPIWAGAVQRKHATKLIRVLEKGLSKGKAGDEIRVLTDLLGMLVRSNILEGSESRKHKKQHPRKQGESP